MKAGDKKEINVFKLASKQTAVLNGHNDRYNTNVTKYLLIVTCSNLVNRALNHIVIVWLSVHLIS